MAVDGALVDSVGLTVDDVVVDNRAFDGEIRKEDGTVVENVIVVKAADGWGDGL